MSSTSTCGVSAATEFLLESYCIHEEFKFHRRFTQYVNLNTQQIFDALVSLYTKFFQMYWSKLKYSLSGMDISSDLSPQKYLALVYISNWFVDLHASNGKIIWHHHVCGFDIPKCYIELHPSPSLFWYDSYLATLNAHIRPTQVKVGNVDTLYVPVICSGSEFPEENPFGIEGFILNLPVCYALMGMLERGQICCTSELCEKKVLGRPSWLLDWHGNSSYAWFPREGNYSMDDITIAFILGVPCSPHLGPVDRDEWQYGLMSSNAKEVARVYPRTRHGCYEARVVETDDWMVPESVRALMSPFLDLGGDKKRQRTNDENPKRLASEHNESDNEACIVTPTSIKRFRVVDYIYHNEVFSKACDDTYRLNALLKIIVSQFR